MSTHFLSYLQEVALKSEIKASEAQITQITAKKEKEMGGQYEKLEKDLEKYGEQVVRVKTQCDSKQDDIKQEDKALAKLRKSHAEVAQPSNISYWKYITRCPYQAKTAVTTKAAEMTKVQAEFDDAKAIHDAKAEEVRKTDELLSTLLTASSGDSDKGYNEQLQGVPIYLFSNF